MITISGLTNRGKNNNYPLRQTAAQTLYTASLDIPLSGHSIIDNGTDRMQKVVTSASIQSILKSAGTAYQCVNRVSVAFNLAIHTNTQNMNVFDIYYKVGVYFG